MLYPAAGFTQSRRHRLLPPDRAGDAPPPGRPAADAGAGARRPGRRAVLREALPAPPSRSGSPTEAGRGRAAGTQGCVVEELADARVAREPRRARAAHPPVDGRRSRGTRPRSCSTSTPARRPTILDCCRVALELRDIARPARPARGREDVGRQGPAPLGAAQHGRRDRTTTRSGSRSRSGSCSSRATRSACTVDMAKDEAAGPGVRRLEPERPPQDDRRARTRCASANGRRSRRRSVGRGRRRARRRRSRRAARSRRPPSSTASTTLGDLYADTLTVHQELPDALGSRAWTSTARSRSSPARAAASAPRPRSRSRERGCKVACAAPRDRRGAAADPRHDRRDRAPHHRRGRRRDRGADEPRRRRRGRAHGRDARSTRFGRVDILVNNAAITFPGDLDLADEALRPRHAGRPARAAASRCRAVLPGHEGARRRRDRERLVGRRAQLLPRPDGVRHGEGRARAPHGVGRAPARGRTASR